MTYPAERKAAIIAKMLPPHNTSLRQLSQEEGISEGTLPAQAVRGPQQRAIAP
jgi:lambda repressor-like predicted transcriptional regulator